ncbi:MAG: IPT/TIG domain-containing protein [Actinobacteria bacterium]|nr:IPT/TIG domain-containing protein [Actinomycetota bacterium]
MKKLVAGAILISLIALIAAPFIPFTPVAAAAPVVSIAGGGGTPRVLGLKQCEPGNYRRAAAPGTGQGDLPPSYDLTNPALPVGDQGSQGSCAGWATGYYYKTYQETKQHGWDASLKDRRFSPSWLYNQACGGSDVGTTYPAVFDIMKQKGIVDIQEFPYNPGDCRTTPTAQQGEAAKPYRISSYAAIWTSPRGNDVGKIKAHIVAGDPVALAVPVYENFYNCQDGFVGVPPMGKSCLGGHALVAVGYDDAAGGGQGGIKIENSWGTSWGQGGFAYLSYEFVSQYVWEAWIMTDRPSDLPVVDSVSPNAGSPGTSVAIKGKDFGVARGEAAVSFNGTPGEVVGWNNESIQVKVSVGSSDGDVRVVNWASEGSNGSNFNVGSYVTSVNPDLARPGDRVTIYGGEFGVNAGEVRLGSDKVKIVSWSDREIVFEAPEKTGTGELVVCTGGEECNPVRFRVARSVWYLAEGYTGGGFEEWVCIQNAENRSNSVEITYMTPDGAVRKPDIEVPPLSRVTVSAGRDVPDTDVSVMLVSDGEILVERAMYWQNRIEGHVSAGVPLPKKEWYLAEGSTAYGFKTWVLVQNPTAEPATVRITYLTPEGPVVRPEFTVAGNRRVTVLANDDVPERDISVKVEASRAVVVERAMYWNNMRGGHNSVASPAPSRNWFLAEGSTLFGFDEWVTLGNPAGRATSARVTYMTPGGAVAGPTVDLPAGSRRTVHVNDNLQSAEVSVKVESDEPIVAERSMYWNKGTGRAGHCALGVTQPSTTQYLPEGCTANGFEEWVLIQNPSATGAVSVELTYMTPLGPAPGPRLDLAPSSRKSVRVNNDLPSSDVSVQVSSSGPVIVERAMYWNGMEGGTDATAIEMGQ